MSYDAKLNEVAMKARALVLWTKKFDTGVCMHGTHNADCRACAVEPPHFPVGIDAFNELESALIEAGLLPRWDFSRPKVQKEPGARYGEAVAVIRNLLGTLRETAQRGGSITGFGALTIHLAKDFLADQEDSGSFPDQREE